MSELKKRPITKRELVIDDYHGTPVADPYRWLEDDTSPEVKEWITEQNEHFQEYMKAKDIKADFKKRLTGLFNYPRCSVPRYVEGKYFAWRNNGLQNHSVLYRLKSLDDFGEVILDPNLLSDDGSVSIEQTSISPKGNYLAYSLSKSGSDWTTIHLLDLRTLQPLPDMLQYTQRTSCAWVPDESGFYYRRYPEQDLANVLDVVTNNSMVCFHALGTQQSADKLIHSEPDHPNQELYVYTVDKEKWLLLMILEEAMIKNKLFYKPTDKPDTDWLPIIADFDDHYDVIDIVDSRAYIITKKDAEFNQVLSVKLTEKGTEDWQTIVPDNGESLEFAVTANKHLLCAYLKDAIHKVLVFDLNGVFVKELPLPAPGSVVELTGDPDRDEFFLSFSSFLYPKVCYRYDFANEKPTVWYAGQVDFAFDEYETKQVFCTSKDGTKVLIFITHKKGIAMDNSHPVLMNGYGGFKASMTPYFSASILAWLEKGGIYVSTCLRGGDEYGEAWHKGGMLENKQNVFDDFIAAGEYMIREGYTTNKKLGIQGFSNGGLLTAACLTQRPDLFGAVIVGMPVIDMLRYHLFTAGRYWTGEYGCAENPEQFPFMYKYSPLHNVKMNTAYPPTLILTADTDDRVVPGQARKFAATLQSADAGDNPIILRIEISSGHGAGISLNKYIDMDADKYTFLFVNLS
jgi:prolyl oligopeptidase